MMQKQTLTRFFKIGSTKLNDPSPNESIEDALKYISVNYSVPIGSTLSEPEIINNEAIYVINPPPSKTKGIF